MRQYLESSHAKEAEEALQAIERSSSVTEAGMRAARALIIIKILMSNGCRAGGILGITHGVVKNAKVDRKTGTMTLMVKKGCYH